MRRINVALRREIGRKTGLGPRQVYRKIQAKVAETHLDPHLAALAVASDLRLALSKYATSEDMAALRGVVKPTAPQAAAPTPQTVPQVSAHVPSVAKLDLARVHRSPLREILRRDFAELAIAQNEDPKRTAKTCMILAGSIAEALLLDALLHRKSKALAAASRLPKKLSATLEEWDLFDLIQVATAMTPPLVPSDIEASAHQLRKWRNLVHPGKELREAKKDRVRPTATRARSAINFVQLLVDELKLRKGGG